MIQTRFYIADDIQTMADGKGLMVGVYPDAVIVLNLPKGAPQPTKELPVGMPTLALMVTVSGLKAGEGMASSTLTRPDGTSEPAVASMKYGVKAGESVNLMVKFAPFLISHEGKYRWTVFLDGEQVVSEFEVRCRDI